MLKSDFAGTGEVFKFTLSQYLKGKSTIITIIVMVIAVMASLFIASYSMYQGQSDFTLESVYFENSTDYEVTVDDIMNIDKGIHGLKLASIDDADAIITIALNNGAYVIKAEGGNNADDLTRLEMAALTSFNTVRSNATAYTSNVSSVSEYLNPSEDDGNSFTANFTVGYVYAVLVMALTMFATTYIIRSVLEEKTSRLVELLMVSVRPMALIAGKILASMCLVLIQLGAMLLGSVGAALIVKYVFGNSFIVEIISATGALGALTNLNAFSVVILIVSVLLGYFTFSIIGGISSACCDSMDDMNQASMGVTFTALAGYAIAMIVSGITDTATSTIVSLVPILNIFTAPARYFMGQISLSVLIAAWAIQILIIALLAVFCKRVYAQLIISRGSRIKLKALLAIAGRKGERA